MSTDTRRGSPNWVAPLAATFAVQTTCAFLQRLVPTIAPVLMAAMDIDERGIGYLISMMTVGAILFLLGGGPLLRRFGPLRSLQIGTLLGGIGCLLLATPYAAVGFFATLLIGLGYGPSAPAGSDILQRYAPPQHRMLIFSVKQSGVPLGGAVAGVVLPPLVAIDWRLALVAAWLITVVTAFSVQPARALTDTARNPGQSLSFGLFFSLANFTAPLTTLRDSPLFRRLCFGGTTLAVSQGALTAFFVLFAVNELKVSLATAGFLFAAMQLSGVPGRIVLGFLADRLGSGLATLSVMSALAALTLTAFAFVTIDTPKAVLAALATISGFTVMSWNGVLIAETARCAAPGRISDTTAAGTIVAFLGYVASPAAFGMILGAFGSYRIAFLATAVVVLGGAVLFASLVGRAIVPEVRQ